MFNNFVQIAGVLDMEEAKMLIYAGVKYIGFPLRLPVHKEDLSEKEAKKIINSFPADVNGVLITYLYEADSINDLADYLNVSIIQLHGEIEVSQIKKINPKHKLIKSLVVAKDNIEKLRKDLVKYTPYVDAFITDTYDPATGASGATGKTHDWEISRELVSISDKPVILAGGLNAGNVFDAILKVKPAGVDSHTGVELENGRKSFERVKLFLKESKRGFTEIYKEANYA